MKDKRCLVTGGARGLGKSICKCFAKEGVHVAVNYRANMQKAQDVAQSLNDDFGVNAFAVGGDISNENDVARIFSESVERFAGLDFLVNNAGICPTTLIEDLDINEWRDVMDINLTGTFLVCREMIRHLRDEGRPGGIVNITSQTAINGSTSGKTHYAASKGGVMSFTHSLALEVSRYGIRVNSISPGVMYTEMTADKTAEDIKRYNDTVPIGRIATVDEVAQGAVYLCSDAAKYITGSDLDISGGMIGR